MLVAFVLMRGHVFKAVDGPLRPQITKFVGVNLLAIVQTLLISLLLARLALPKMGIEGEDAEALGHVIGVLVPVVTSYFGHRFLTFR